MRYWSGPSCRNIAIRETHAHRERQTFVAKTIRSRVIFRLLIQWPRYSSLRPWVSERWGTGYLHIGLHNAYREGINMNSRKWNSILVRNVGIIEWTRKRERGQHTFLQNRRSWCQHRKLGQGGEMTEAESSARRTSWYLWKCKDE